MTSLAPITIEQCRLLDPKNDQDLVDQYNRAVQIAEEIRRQFGIDSLNSGVVKKLSSVGEVLTRPRYSIGAIGVTGSGKSTTINSILGVTRIEDRPVPEAAVGANTTATMTRLRNASQNELTLTYLTRQEFDEKRKYLCSIVGFPPEMDDDDILRELPRHIEKATAGLLVHPDEARKVERDDPVRLEKLLTARKHHGSLLGEESPTVKHLGAEGYCDRRRYLAYGPDEHPANGLLNYAQIGLNNANLPEELEIFDLPGPGAMNSVDVWTTRRSLNELNGVLWFVSVQDLGKAAMHNVVVDLVKKFGERFAPRVWVVFTKWDTLTAGVLHGDGESSIFGNIGKLVEDLRMQASQVKFFSYEFVGLDVDSVKQRLCFKLGSDSHEPRGLKNYPEFRDTYDFLLEEGGVSELRRLILETLPAEVRESTRDFAVQDLSDIIRELERHRTTLQRRHNATKEQRAQFIAANASALRAVDAIQRDKDLLHTTAAKTQKKLYSQFVRLFDPNGDGRQAKANVARAGDIPRYFRLAAEQLEELLDSETQDRIKEAYEKYSPCFEGQDVPVLHCDSPSALWNELQIQDESDPSWRGVQFPHFADDQMFRYGEYADLAKGDVFWEMMCEKITLTSQQSAYAVYSRLWQRAKEVQQALFELCLPQNSTAKN